jgi:hypothetical protein
MMGKALDGNLRDKRLAVEAATATIKAAIATDKHVLKATRNEFPYVLKPLEFPIIPKLCAVSDAGLKYFARAGGITEAPLQGIQN